MRWRGHKSLSNYICPLFNTGNSTIRTFFQYFNADYYAMVTDLIILNSMPFSHETVLNKYTKEESVISYLRCPKMIYKARSTPAAIMCPEDSLSIWSPIRCQEPSNLIELSTSQHPGGATEHWTEWVRFWKFCLSSYSGFSRIRERDGLASSTENYKVRE